MSGINVLIPTAVDKIASCRHKFLIIIRVYHITICLCSHVAFIVCTFIGRKPCLTFIYHFHILADILNRSRHQNLHRLTDNDHLLLFTSVRHSCPGNIFSLCICKIRSKSISFFLCFFYSARKKIYLIEAPIIGHRLIPAVLSLSYLLPAYFLPIQPHSLLPCYMLPPVR